MAWRMRCKQKRQQKYRGKLLQPHHVLSSLKQDSHQCLLLCAPKRPRSNIPSFYQLHDLSYSSLILGEHANTFKKKDYMKFKGEILAHKTVGALGAWSYRQSLIFPHRCSSPRCNSCIPSHRMDAHFFCRKLCVIHVSIIRSRTTQE